MALNSITGLTATGSLFTDSAAADTITNDNTISLNFTANFASGGAATATIYLWAFNGTIWSLVSTPGVVVNHSTGSGNSAAGAFTNVTVPDGAYTSFGVSNSNTTPPGGGGVVSATSAGSWTIDTAAPVFGAVTVAGDDAITTTGEESSFHVTGTVTGANGQTVTVKLLGLDGLTVVDTKTAVISGGSYDVTFTGDHLAAGTHNVTVSTTDLAGNPATHTETFSSSVCFLAGTMIRTPVGETAIEALAIGDMIMTADGSAKPVKFIGRQTISMIFADKLKTQPILIKAGALDENVPARDLYTSPGHSMLVDGVLTLSSALVNGNSIVRWENTPKVFTYYHIELEGHEIVFAEGAATETYCDNVTHDVFDNGREYKAMYPNAKPIVQMDLPTVKSQRQLPAATRRRLAERAVAIGARVQNVA